jgi:hypothetical protein
VSNHCDTRSMQEPSAARSIRFRRARTSTPRSPVFRDPRGE